MRVIKIHLRGLYCKLHGSGCSPESETGYDEPCTAPRAFWKMTPSEPFRRWGPKAAGDTHTQGCSRAPLPPHEGCRRGEAMKGALEPIPADEAPSVGGDLPRCRPCVAFTARDQWSLLAFAGTGSRGLSSRAGMPIKL